MRLFSAVIAAAMIAGSAFAQDEDKAKLKADILKKVDEIIRANAERTLKEIESLLDRELGTRKPAPEAPQARRPQPPQTGGRPFLGIQPAEGAESGIEVGQVVPGSPAEGKLEAGDVIQKFNGQDVGDVQSLAQEIMSAGVGSEVTLTVARGDKTQEIKVTLGRAPEQPGMPPQEEPDPEPEPEAKKPENIPTPTQRPVLGVIVEAAEQGLKITEVRENSPAQKGGVLAGDILVGINGEAVKGEETLGAFMRTAKVGDKAELKVLRGEETKTLTVILEERK